MENRVNPDVLRDAAPELLAALDQYIISLQVEHEALTIWAASIERGDTSGVAEGMREAKRIVNDDWKRAMILWRRLHNIPARPGR
jgi:hypothetical protein